MARQLGRLGVVDLPDLVRAHLQRVHQHDVAGGVGLDGRAHKALRLATAGVTGVHKEVTRLDRAHVGVDTGDAGWHARQHAGALLLADRPDTISHVGEARDLLARQERGDLTRVLHEQLWKPTAYLLTPLRRRVVRLGLLEHEVDVHRLGDAELHAAILAEHLDQVAQVVGGRDDAVVGVVPLYAVQGQRVAPDGVVIRARLEHRARHRVEEVARLDLGGYQLVDAAGHDRPTEQLEFDVCHRRPAPTG
jgi:hypothetical protein